MQEVSNTKAAFNKAALTYDEEEERNPILIWMRSLVRRIYLLNFRPGDKVLELNSGTGVDAVFLARQGIKVTATDISERMIEIIRSRAAEENAGNVINAFAYPFERIGEVEGGDFDGVISNFGGLNCINDFEKLAFDLSSKLKSGGNFIAVVMNKICPWEIFYYVLRFDLKSAFRRFHRAGIDVVIHGEKVRTFYYSPRAFAAGFLKYFKVNRIYSLGLYTPPPFLIGIYNKLKPVIKLFMVFDSVIKGVFPFNRFGDHFIVVLEKRSAV